MPGPVAVALGVLGWLMVKHWLCDFVLQTRSQREQKGVYGRSGGLLHAGLHSLFTAPALLVAPAPVLVAAAVLGGEFLVHYHLDWAKERLLRHTGWTYEDAGYWRAFGLDQLLHGATYLAITGVLLTSW